MDREIEWGIRFKKSEKRSTVFGEKRENRYFYPPRSNRRRDAGQLLNEEGASGTERRVWLGTRVREQGWIRLLEVRSRCPEVPIFVCISKVRGRFFVCDGRSANIKKRK